MEEKKLISIITPCFNEEDNVRVCYEAVRDLFEKTLTQYDYEHIFCDNASTDNTVSNLKEIAGEDKRIRIIVNARNFGPFRSTFNGLMQARGSAVVPMLAVDLQDPPELIAEFVKRWEDGHEIVYGIRKNREENMFLVAARKIYYRTVNAFADVYIPPDVGEFQLIDKVVLQALSKFEDYYPYIRGMIATCGFKSTGVNYTWVKRKHGVSKNRFYHLLDQGMNGIISFTNVPLRLCMITGFIIASASLSWALFNFVYNLIFFREVMEPGIATLIVALFFFSGVQLFFLGFLGEYIGAIHFQVRKRPLVIEKERVNF